ncbi:MAG: glycosyltransferase family 2 protein, partial [Paracoccus sp. (in: a-proteobacteria)]
PTVALLGAVLIHPLCLLLLLAYPVQYLRLTARMGAARALFTLLGKFPEAIGALGFYRNLLMRRRNTLIEYK